MRATLYVDNAPVREEFGELGFSERGIEGAVALRMSRDAVDALIDGHRVKLVVDLKPALTEEQLRNYDCPIQLVSHGHIPHTVLEHHPGDGCCDHDSVR